MIIPKGIALSYWLVADNHCWLFSMCYHMMPAMLQF